MSAFPAGDEGEADISVACRSVAIASLARSVSRYAYITWSEETFPKYIRAPMQEMPGTRMVFVGIKNDKDSADLWAYLKQFGTDGAKK